MAFIEHRPSRQQATLQRALESLRPDADRLFIDPYAAQQLSRKSRLLMPWWRTALGYSRLRSRADRGHKGAWDSALCRTSFFDKKIEHALQRGVTQLVLLGAGSDNRVMRLPRVSSVAVFEVDDHDSICEKRYWMRSEFERQPGNVRYVSCDLQRQPLADGLALADFDPAARTMFVLEGLSQYLDNAAMDRLLLTIKSLSAPGSELLMSFVSDSFIAAKKGAARRFLRRQRKRGEPWQWGLSDELAAPLCEELGFELQQLLRAEDYGEALSRLQGRKLRLSKVERVLHAIK